MVAFHAPIHPQAVPIPGKSRPVVPSMPDQRIAATLVTGFLGSGKTTLINAVLDPAAGSESGRIGNLNPQSKLKKK